MSSPLAIGSLALLSLSLFVTNAGAVYGCASTPPVEVAVGPGPFTGATVPLTLLAPDGGAVDAPGVHTEPSSIGFGSTAPCVAVKAHVIAPSP